MYSYVHIDLCNTSVPSLCSAGDWGTCNPAKRICLASWKQARHQRCAWFLRVARTVTNPRRPPAARPRFFNRNASDFDVPPMFLVTAPWVWIRRRGARLVRSMHPRCGTNEAPRHRIRVSHTWRSASPSDEAARQRRRVNRWWPWSTARQQRHDTDNHKIQVI
jgi:hypothetical protein